VTPREIQAISGRALGEITAKDGPGDERAARLQRCLLPQDDPRGQDARVENVEIDRAKLCKLA
jgi:hypothetical protein